MESNPYHQYSRRAISEDIVDDRDIAAPTSTKLDNFVVVYDPEEIVMLAKEGLLWFSCRGSDYWERRWGWHLDSLWQHCWDGDYVVGVQVEH